MRTRGSIVGALAVLTWFVGLSFTTPASAVPATATVPETPAGAQLTWLLGATAHLPLNDQDITTHFDANVTAQISPAALNAALAQHGGGPMTLLRVSDQIGAELIVLVAQGSARLSLELSVDSSGLIASLLLSPVTAPAAPSWPAVNRELGSIAPGVGLLAARIGPNGSCTTVHSVNPATPRPLGSMFKLFILGALANAIHAGRLSWSQMLTITAAIKVGGSGVLASEPDGTTLTLEQAADLMISVSDNTAADLLLGLVGRAAVEREVRAWSSHADLDDPFLTVNEMFALKYDDYPKLANRFLSLGPAARARYLASTVDKVPQSSLAQVGQPRDINTIEWFASPEDMCHAFAGLSKLQRVAGLGPIASVLSINDGEIDLTQADWPTLWFKGGSEPGVLTLGYLGRDSAGHTDVVVAMTENPHQALAATATTRLLGVVAAAFGLLARSR